MKAAIIFFSAIFIVLSIFWSMLVTSLQWPFEAWIAGEIIALIFMITVLAPNIFGGGRHSGGKPS